MADRDDLIREANQEIARADKLLKVSEAAALSGVPKRTIWRWVEKDAIPCVRRGPTRRIFIAESVARSWTVAA